MPEDGEVQQVKMGMMGRFVALHVPAGPTTKEHLELFFQPYQAIDQPLDERFWLRFVDYRWLEQWAFAFWAN